MPHRFGHPNSPRHVLFDDLDELNTFEERQDSFQLEDFRTCNFSNAMDGELAAVIQDNDKIVERYLPLISYFCAVSSPQYVCPPTRLFRTGSPNRDAALRDTYEDSELDLRLLEAQQKSVGQNSVLMLVDPVRVPRQVRVTSWISGEYVVEGDPMLEDIRNADRLTVRWPVRRTESIDGGLSQVWFGRRVYTPTEAFLELPGGERQGLFNPNDLDDLGNPFGYIPAVAVRLCSPPRGWFKPRLPIDLLRIQLAVIISMSDIENITRQKCAGREVVIGEDAHSAVKKAHNAGPGLWALNGEGISYQAENLDPRIDRYAEGLELMLKLWARYRFTSPEGLWKSTGITGAAKAAEQTESIFEVHRTEHKWRVAERRLSGVVADVARIPSLVGSRPRTIVEYHYPRPPQNDLQEMQSTALGAALGQVDLVARFARMNKIPAALAEQRYIDNLKRWQDLVATWSTPSGETFIPPGIDSIAQQVLRTGQAGRPSGDTA